MINLKREYKLRSPLKHIKKSNYMKEGVIIIPMMHVMNLKTREVKIPKICELVSIREPVYEPRKSVCRGHASQSLFLEVCIHTKMVWLVAIFFFPLPCSFEFSLLCIGDTYIIKTI